MKREEFEWLKRWLGSVLYGEQDPDYTKYSLDKATEEYPPPIDEEKKRIHLIARIVNYEIVSPIPGNLSHGIALTFDEPMNISTLSEYKGRRVKITIEEIL